MDRLVRVAIFVLCISGMATGCASSKSAEKESSSSADQAAAEESQAPEARELYRAARPWLPADPKAVVAASGEPLWSYLESVIPPADDEVDEGAPGTRRALREDVTRQFRTRLGLDPTNLEGVVLGLRPRQRPSAVIFGDFEPSGPAERVELESGPTAFRLPLTQVQVMGESLNRGQVWAMPIEKPRPGMVVTMSRPHLAKIADGAASDGESTDRETPGKASGEATGGQRASNRKPAAEDPYEKLFDAVGEARLVVASPIGSIEQLKPAASRLPVSMPDAVVVGAAPALTVAARGDEATLDELQSYVDQKVQEFDRRSEKIYDRVDDQGLAAAMAGVFLYHMSKSTRRQLEPDRKDGRLRYRLRTGAGMQSAALLGTASAVAVPAFERYQTRSKTAEAEPVMGQMADATKTQFLSEQYSCRGQEDCKYPWHTSEKAGMPVPFSEYVFPGGTNARLETTSTVPSSGETYTAKLSQMNAEAEGVDEDRARELLVGQLGVPAGEELQFRYVYTTGPKRGADASATIKAIADFDPSTPEKHTVVQEITVDNDSQTVVLGQPVTKNEFE